MNFLYRPGLSDKTIRQSAPCRSRLPNSTQEPLAGSARQAAVLTSHFLAKLGQSVIRRRINAKHSFQAKKPNGLKNGRVHVGKHNISASFFGFLTRLHQTAQARVGDWPDPSAINHDLAMPIDNQIFHTSKEIRTGKRFQTTSNLNNSDVIVSQDTVEVDHIFISRGEREPLSDASIDRNLTGQKPDAVGSTRSCDLSHSEGPGIRFLYPANRLPLGRMGTLWNRRNA